MLWRCLLGSRDLGRDKSKKTPPHCCQRGGPGWPFQPHLESHSHFLTFVGGSALLNNPKKMGEVERVYFRFLSAQKDTMPMTTAATTAAKMATSVVIMGASLVG